MELTPYQRLMLRIASAILRVVMVGNVKAFSDLNWALIKIADKAARSGSLEFNGTLGPDEC